MELDDLKHQWELQDAKLDRCIRLNTQLLHANALNKAETRLRRLSRWLWVDVVVDFGLLLLLGSFLVDHFSQVQFMLPAAVLHVCVIVLMIPGIRQIVGIAKLDYGEPIVTIQKRLESLRRERLRVIRYILLLSPLLWILAVIVSFKGLFNVNAYAVLPSDWLAGNIMLGVLWIVLGVFISRRYADRMKANSFARRFMRDLAGYNLNAATDILQSLENFEKEQPA